MGGSDGGATYDQMNVSGTVWVSVEQLQDFAGWSVKGDRVRGRSDAVEGVFAVLVCLEFAVEVVVDLGFVLL